MEAVISNSLIETNMEIMRKTFSMDGNEVRALGSIICASQGLSPNAEKLNECKKILKDEFGMLSVYRGYLQTLLILKMSLSDDPKGYLKAITDTFEKLKTNSKTGNDFRLLGAVILYDNTTEGNRDEACARTLEIYEKMQRDYSSFTDRSGMPIAAIMAIQNRDIDKMLEDTGKCYEILRKNKKFEKNDLITVSHILSMNDASPEEKCEKFLKLHQLFKDNKMKLSYSHVTILAVLANSGMDINEILKQTSENDEKLKKIKGFHGIAGMDSMSRRVLAASITALNNSDEATLVEGMLMSTVISVVMAIEILIMILVIASTTAAVANS